MARLAPWKIIEVLEPLTANQHIPVPEHLGQRMKQTVAALWFLPFAVISGSRPVVGISAAAITA
jgi:hypothetical protein